MKFGKALKKIRGSCNPEWFPYWLNYKLLKNKIKTLVKYSGTPITQDKKETDFFLLINQELKKTNLFYESEFKCLVIRYNRSKYAIKEFEQDSNRVMPDSWAKCMKACMQLYKDCVELESYVVMQYCGYSKILKKHDKNTGYVAPYIDFFIRFIVPCLLQLRHTVGVYEECR
jgi:SPX domain protein involved in polyphosphate accumulation